MNEEFFLTVYFQYPEDIRRVIYTTNIIELVDRQFRTLTKTKSSFPTIDSAFKMLYLATQEAQEKWNRNGVRNWSEIYPQLCIFFSEVMEKYTK